MDTIPKSLQQYELDRFRHLDSMEGIERAEVSLPPRLFLKVPRGRLLYAVYPGLLAALTIALASTWLSQHYGAPVMLFALLFGMAFHFLHEEGRCVAGIEFASRTVLRTGIALLGARITFEQLAGLGPAPILMVIAGVATTILFGWAAGKALGLGKNLAFSRAVRSPSAAPRPRLPSPRCCRARRTPTATPSLSSLPSPRSRPWR